MQDVNDVLVEVVRNPRFDVGRMKDDVDSRQNMKHKKIMLREKDVR